MRLPDLKKISRIAALRCRKNGFVFNAFGRRRHLPAVAAHKAFNTVIQGCAMDYIKTRMNALAPRYNERMRDWGMKPFVNVHDELAWYIPNGLLAAEPEVLPYVNQVLCYQTVPFRIPFVWDLGFSEKSWAEASGDDVVKNDNGLYLGGPLERISA
jgi:DNA polymerase I-like protein with 3'-5' exonuclease and polymerase domains